LLEEDFLTAHWETSRETMKEEGGGMKKQHLDINFILHRSAFVRLD